MSQTMLSSRMNDQLKRDFDSICSEPGSCPARSITNEGQNGYKSSNAPSQTRLGVFFLEGGPYVGKRESYGTAGVRVSDRKSVV